VCLTPCASRWRAALSVSGGVGGTATYPARFCLLLAANPCPCARTESSCTCRPLQRASYLSRLSGPLLDRIDVQVALGAITRGDIQAERGVGEASALVAERVAQARTAALMRYVGTPWRTNADVPPTALQRQWPIARAALEVVGKAMDDGHLTVRGYGRVLRLAWTMADLGGVGTPRKGDVDLALGLRLGPRWTAVAA